MENTFMKGVEHASFEKGKIAAIEKHLTLCSG